MSRYAFTPAAARDLNEIWDYIAEDNRRAADEVLSEIEASIEALVDRPRMSHRRDELVDESLGGVSVGGWVPDLQELSWNSLREPRRRS